MDDTSIYVAPDGALLDRVAEFAFTPNSRVAKLYECDEVGYQDSLAKLIQTIAIGGVIVGSGRIGPTEAAQKFKDSLGSFNRLRKVDFFNEEKRGERNAWANDWLSNHWDSICAELKNPHSEASVAYLGHLRREYFLYWLKEDKIWTAEWYSKPKDIKPLPDSVKRRLGIEMSNLAKQNGDSRFNEPTFHKWIEQSASTHYRVFAEYWLYFGDETGCEYMPSLSRSSLRSLTPATNAVSSLVMPFVALEAIKKVKSRADLLPRIIEWTEGSGRNVVEGLKNLQRIARSARNPAEEKAILDEVSAILKSKTSLGYNVTLNLIRLATGTAAKNPDISAATKLAEYSVSKSYRWLWQLRQPEIQSAWQSRVRELSLT